MLSVLFLQSKKCLSLVWEHTLLDLFKAACGCFCRRGLKFSHISACKMLINIHKTGFQSYSYTVWLHCFINERPEGETPL